MFNNDTEILLKAYKSQLQDFFSILNDFERSYNYYISIFLQKSFPDISFFILVKNTLKFKHNFLSLKYLLSYKYDEEKIADTKRELQDLLKKDYIYDNYLNSIYEIKKTISLIQKIIFEIEKKLVKYGNNIDDKKVHSEFHNFLMNNVYWKNIYKQMRNDFVKQLELTYPSSLSLLYANSFNPNKSFYPLIS